MPNTPEETPGSMTTQKTAGLSDVIGGALHKFRGRLTHQELYDLAREIEIGVERTQAAEIAALKAERDRLKQDGHLTSCGMSAHGVSVYGDRKAIEAAQAWAHSHETVPQLQARIVTAESSLETIRMETLKYAVIEEFDWPGDVAVSCGFHCLICGALHGETPETVPHENGCVLAAPNQSERRSDRP